MDLRVKVAIAALSIGMVAPAVAAVPGSQRLGQEDLSNLSIEQLAQIEVRSASKRLQPLSAVPASMYVIDHDAIVRSAALTLPEMLRLAPNLQVFQQAPGQWVVRRAGSTAIRRRRVFPTSCWC